MASPFSKLATRWRRDTGHGKPPTVSVVIPTYNSAAFLARAIDSALGQDLLDQEVIVVDDGSTDGTAGLLDSRYGGNPSVRVLRHERNRNQGAARNTGLDAARGESIFFLDADDWIDPPALRHLTSLAKSSEAEIVACGARLAYGDGRVEPFHAHAFGCDGGREALRELVAYRIGSIVWNKLYRREFIERNRLRFVDSLGKEDVLFTTEAVFACRRYLSIDDVYCNYLQRDDSCINATPTIRHLESFIRLYVDFSRFVERNRLDADAEGAEISRGLFRAHGSADLYPRLITYVRTRSSEQWESECWAACNALLGAGGFAVADLLIRAMQDSRSLGGEPS